MSPFEHGEVFVLDDGGEVASIPAIQNDSAYFLLRHGVKLFEYILLSVSFEV